MNLTADYLQFCETEVQRETLKAFLASQSTAKVAVQFGKHHRNIEKMLGAIRTRAQLAGYSPEHGIQAGLMPIEKLNGRSFQAKDEHGRLTWFKTSVDEEKRRKAIADWIDRLSDDVKPLPPIKAPKKTGSELLAVIPMGDPHFGMYAWAEEAGDDFDLDKADKLTRGAIDRLVSVSPPADECLLINVGDFFHADNTTNRTPASGHALDVDTRFDKIMQVAEDCMVYCIRRLLERFPVVRFWSIPGNHDPHCGSPLARILRAYFRNNPRVVIDCRPGKYNYMRWGKCLVGSTHGDGAKTQDLPLIMATDCAEDWGKTWFRVWYVGHIHHKYIKEFPGCTVEHVRTLASRDAWHQAMGYRALRDMQLILLDKAVGEVARFRCDKLMADGQS